MNTLKISLIAVMLAATAPAFADAPADGAKGDHRHKMHERMKAADKDGDGKIRRAEADASLPRLAKNFDAIDTNKDGFVTKDEMKAFREKNGGGK